MCSGPLRSRAAKAIGFIDTMIDYSLANSPLQKELSAGKFCKYVPASVSYSYVPRACSTASEETIVLLVPSLLS